MLALAQTHASYRSILTNAISKQSQTMAKPAVIDTLIIVCCHAIWVEDGVRVVSDNRIIEDGWLIEPFQIDKTSTFVKHIAAGIKQLLFNKNAILVFSGGATKPDRTWISEAVSYNLYARRYGMLDDSDLLMRTFMEADATDSFQNVLFSLIRFPQFVQHYQQAYTKGRMSENPAEQPPFPQRLILISHDFKRARFEQLHLPAIRYPVNATRFEYLGIDPPFSGDKMQEIKEGDAIRGYGAWLNDLYGRDKLLASKRIARGWTGLRQQVFAKVTREWLAENSGMGETIKRQLEQVTNFVGDCEGQFPERVPWSGKP